jgi:iron complex outermembrane recepter protein
MQFTGSAKAARRCAVAFVCATATAQAAGTDDRVIELKEIIVTAPSADGTLRTTPHGVTAITASDIARSTATGVGELLSREANLNLQSYFGGDRRTSIDIRGMGATAASNVLVLVDGERLNEPDLSGADLSTVSLARIRRIEIVRGGGAVRYGNGAVGGVVNILTRRASPGPASLEVQSISGSYDTWDRRIAASGSTGILSGAVQASDRGTDGYRRNGDVRARDFAAEVRLTPARATGLVDLHLRAAMHEDDSGLPGPVDAAAFVAGNAARRSTLAPHDRSRTNDARVGGGATLEFGAAGRLELRASYRDRSNPYLIGMGNTLPTDTTRFEAAIESRRRDLEARYEWEPTSTVSIAGGLMHQRADYLRRENGFTEIGSSTRRAGDVDNFAQYATASWRAAPSWTLNAGARNDRFSTQQADTRFTRDDCTTVFDTVLVDIGGGIFVPVSVPRQTGCTDAFRTQSSRGATWRNRAFELGLVWQPREHVTAFGSVTHHFRNPNVDELMVASTDLRPQRGRTLEAGIRQSWGDSVETGLTVFHMAVDDEIQYGLSPTTGLAVNRNLDRPTRRLGGEAELRWRATPWLTFRANAGYVSPRVVGAGFDVPLVPRVTANASVDWAVQPWVRAAFAVRHAGTRADGNEDGTGRFPALPAYTVFDAALHFERDTLRLTVGVNNLFDKVYSPLAFSATYYPMPDRNLYVALRWRL